MKQRVTVITSSAGGTGKTFFAASAASLLSKKKKVLLLDLTLYGGIEVLVRHSKKLSGLNILYSQFEQGQPLEIHKAILESDSVIGTDVLMNAHPLTMEKLSVAFVEALFQRLRMTDYEEIIVDTSMELSQRNSKFFQLADQVIYMINQDISVCWKTMKHLEIMDKLQVERDKIHMVMNRYRKDIVFNLDEFVEETGIKAIGIIPDGKSSVMNLHNEGKTVHSLGVSPIKKALKKSVEEIWF
ncbi:MAG: hypothetical protein JXR88_01065 [Clostridia bacterium]|nr:hypothetical protein [Clostridia bacterium]